MPTIVSFINLKGGVAKTTSLIQLAETLAFHHNQRILVIDLDPQTNATIALMGERRWEEVDEAGQTIAHLFQDKLNGTGRFDPQRAIVRGVSNLNRIAPALMDTLQPELRYPRVDLLPSSIRLIDVQDRMAEIASKTHHMMNPMEVLKFTFEHQFSLYDHVLVDCPPNLGYITQNGLEISDYYLIPTIADRLSTYGIPQIIRNIHTFQQARRLKIRPLGVVVTKFQNNSATHAKGLRALPGQLARAFEDVGLAPAPLFSTRLPQANATAEAMDFDREVANFKEKYGRGKSGDHYLYDYPIQFAEEFLTHVNTKTEDHHG